MQVFTNSCAEFLCLPLFLGCHQWKPLDFPLSTFLHELHYNQPTAESSSSTYIFQIYQIPAVILFNTISKERNTHFSLFCLSIRYTMFIHRLCSNKNNKILNYKPFITKRYFKHCLSSQSKKKTSQSNQLIQMYSEKSVVNFLLIQRLMQRLAPSNWGNSVKISLQD